MLKELIKISNELDGRGLTAEADVLDLIIKKYTSQNNADEQPRRTWWRVGGPDEYSEFTFDPSGRGGPARMSGGRGSGFASGQYAFGEPGEGRVEVVPAKNPLIIRTERAALSFQEDAISIMRFAEAWDKHKNLYIYDDFGYAKRTLGTLLFSLSGLAPANAYSENTEWQVLDAIKSWSIHKQVHPMNILLSRWGYDGVEFLGKAKRFANSGQFGNVKFPPISQDGEVLGLLSGRGSTYMFMKDKYEQPKLSPVDLNSDEYAKLKDSGFRPEVELEEEDNYPAGFDTSFVDEILQGLEDREEG